VKTLLHELGKEFKIENFVQLVISSKTVSVSSEKNWLSTISYVHDDLNHGVTSKNVDRTKIILNKEKLPEQAVPENLAVFSVPTISNITSTYCQKSCPTLKDFLKKPDQTMRGQVAVEQLIKKEVPAKKDVRVRAKKMPGILRPGVAAGLHEIVPTNQIEILARIKDDKFRLAIGLIQSGARTSTALTIFNQYNQKYQADPDKHLVAHTGLFYPAPSHTKGQDDAHNQLRKPIEDFAEFSDDQMLIHFVNQHLNISPHGKKIMEDPGITGEVSILSQIGKISKSLQRSGINIWYSKKPFRPSAVKIPFDWQIEPLNPSYSELIEKLLASIPRVEPVKTSRAKFAIKLHEQREEMKDRVRAVIDSISPNSGASPDGRIRSPSPCRTPIELHHETTYTGGDHQDGYERPLPDLPTFPTLADKAAWITAPQRLGFKDT
jgi:hypothetical protein